MSKAVTDEVHAPLINNRASESAPRDFNTPEFYNPMNAQEAAYYSPPNSPPPPRDSFVSERAMHTSYDSGYDHKEPQDRSSVDKPPKPRSRWGSLSGEKLAGMKWQALFAGVTFIQGCICLAFEVYVYLKFNSSLKPKVAKDFQKQIEVIPLFLPLFVFGYIYENIIVWDALRAKNTIQIIGVCLANLALVVYTAIQALQIHEALEVNETKGSLKPGYTPDSVFDDTKAYLIAIPFVMLLTTVFMAVCAWKLYREFAWTILKIVGADYKMKQRYMAYQIYIALLKFDFFFLVGFLMQLVVVTHKSDPEYAITITAIPVTIVILLAAAYFTRKEYKWGMAICFLLYLAALSYFSYKLSQLTSSKPNLVHYYKAVRKPLITFAVVTLVMDLATIANAILCTFNFGKGLRDYFESKGKNDESQQGQNMSNLEQGRNNRVSRLTID